MKTSIAFLIFASAAVGCAADGPGQLIAQSQGGWLVYSDVAPNPAANIHGAVQAFQIGPNSMRLEVQVSGLPGNRKFGSHLHKLACDDPMKAGGHYQHIPAPAGQANNPMYTNTTNEAWLDFVTDTTGATTFWVEVPWIPRKGEAKGVIVHNNFTDTMGLAGPKLACLPVTGF